METKINSKFAVRHDKRGGHSYYLNDIRIPGVTTILSTISKPALVNWAKKEAIGLVEKHLRARMGENLIIDEDYISQTCLAGIAEPDRIKGEAANLGKKAHLAISKILNGESPGDLTGIEIVIESFLKWKNSNPFQVIKFELPLHSETYRFAGTIDVIGKGNDGNCFVGDWKTSKSVWPEMALQVAAYIYLANSNRVAPDLIKKGYIFHIGKNSVEFNVYEIKDVAGMIDGFLECKQLYDSLKKIELVKSSLSNANVLENGGIKK